MKKILSILILTACLAPMSFASAIDTPTGWETLPNTGINTGNDVITSIERIGLWIFAAVIAIAVVFLIVAAFLWVTAGGNEENIKKARTMLINALIGVAIALAAQGLINVVSNILTGRIIR
jgi:hypothetical protein